MSIIAALSFGVLIAHNLEKIEKDHTFEIGQPVCIPSLNNTEGLVLKTWPLNTDYQILFPTGNTVTIPESMLENCK